MSKTTALTIGNIMLFLNKIFKIKPLITPTAVEIFCNNEKISIEKAKKLLDYNPKISYEQGMKEVKKWLEKEQYI